MTGIFKSCRQNNSDPMKHLGLVRILLLLGVGLLLLGPAAAELTAFQNLISSAEVGQMVTVTVSLTYNGPNYTQASVTPSLPPGVVANGPGGSTQLYPGVTQQISYPFTAQQSGTYWIVSEITYSEDGTWRNLRLEDPFTATEVPQPPPMPEVTSPDNVRPEDNRNPADPFATPAGGVPPEGGSPPETQPSNQTPGQGEQPPGWQ